MDYQEFADKYKPQEQHYDWTVPADWDKLMSTHPQRIWTAVDVDGKMYLTTGFTRCNRLYHIICDVPYNEGQDIEVPLS